MKTLYLDCGMGAAGDMLAAALLELLPEPRRMLETWNALGIPGVRFAAAPAEKCGIRGTRVSVTVDGAEEGAEADAAAHAHPHEHEHAAAHSHPHAHEHEHEHAHMGLSEIGHVVEGHLTLPDAVKQDVLAVFQLVAEAESRVHGCPLPEIHFHELGTMDAVVDIAAVCLLMHEIAPDEVIVSPVHVGCGQVRCAHGLLPVPAPATALLLQGVPIYGGTIEGELCTPTGAALLRHFADRFGAMPVMRSERIGYGMGKKDFPAANCVRALLGERAEGTEGCGADVPGGAPGLTDEILELACNVDDMSAEAIAFACAKLLEAGALDVFTLPAGMKKGRPGTLLTVLCRPAEKAAMLRTIFLHTSTLGVRESAAKRYVLARETETLETPWGPVRRKISSGYGVRRAKYEYDDLVRLAEARGCSLEEARALLEDL